MIGAPRDEESNELPSQSAGPGAVSLEACPHCNAPLREGVQSCTQCGHRVDAAMSSEVRGGQEKISSPLEGLISQEVPELFQIQPTEPKEVFESETPAPLPDWLDIPLVLEEEPAISSSSRSAITSRLQAPAVDLPPVSSELPPASILLVSTPSRPIPSLDAQQVNRLQELAERGPWSEVKPEWNTQDRGMLPLPSDVPSVLLAECRHKITTVALIEAVEGTPRFVAGGQVSTGGDPVSAVREACEGISACTGRSLFDERDTLLTPQRSTGHGVDRFIAVVGVDPLFQGVFTSAEDSRLQESLKEAQGLGQLQAWGGAPPRSVPSCLATVIRYQGETYHTNVVGLDLGMAQSWLATWYQGRLTVVAGEGLLTSSADRGAARALITGLWHQCAVENEILSPDQPPVLNLAVVRGPALAQGFTPVEIARLLVDGLQLRGACTLLWDKDGLAAPLGALAASDPAMAASLLGSDAFLRLGTLVAPSGRPPRKGIALRYTLSWPEGRSEQGSVASGHLRQIPLPPGHSARLTLRLASGLNLGTGQLERRAQAEVPGGLAGLLLDGRGRLL